VGIFSTAFNEGKPSPMTCREKNACELEDILRLNGSMSIGSAAQLMGRGVRYIHSLVRQFPGKFDLMGISGGVGTWCIGNTDPERPIQFVLSERND
jgi:hypothetical protein